MLKMDVFLNSFTGIFVAYLMTFHLINLLFIYQYPLAPHHLMCQVANLKKGLMNILIRMYAVFHNKIQVISITNSILPLWPSG